MNGTHHRSECTILCIGVHRALSVQNAWLYTMHEYKQCITVHNVYTQCTSVHSAWVYTMHGHDNLLYHPQVCIMLAKSQYIAFIGVSQAHAHCARSTVHNKALQCWLYQHSTLYSINAIHVGRVYRACIPHVHTWCARMSAWIRMSAMPNIILCAIDMACLHSSSWSEKHCGYDREINTLFCMAFGMCQDLWHSANETATD